MKIIIDKTEILKIKLKLKKSHEKYKNKGTPIKINTNEIDLEDIFIYLVKKNE